MARKVKATSDTPVAPKKKTDLLVSTKTKLTSQVQVIRISRTSSVVAHIELDSLRQKADLASLGGCIAASELAVARWAID